MGSAKLLSFWVIYLFSTVSMAVCQKAQICDDYGMNCQVRDVCESTLDLPSVGLAPLPPLPSMEIKPLPSMQLPPLGTTRCQQIQVNGRWQNLCE